MCSKLNIVLGAGFSYYADIPLVKDITKRFNRDNKENILRHSSLEWQWKDYKDEATINNGSLSFDRIGGGILLNHLVDEYIAEAESFENYEMFFQFILDKINNDENWINQLFNSALETMNSEYPEIQDHYKNILRNPDNELIKGLINELISDMLTTRSEIDIDKYSQFIKFIKTYTTINIFSLNHDILLESLLNYFELPYTDGFSSNNSTIRYQNNSQKIFQNNYSENGIRIYKLHGSKDVIDFKVMVKDGLIYNPTGEQIHFKPESYHAKHLSQRIDINSGETIQNFQPNTSPFFVTGSDKMDKIENNEMLNTLFQHFTNELNDNSDLLIIGYSFSDEHINGVIRNNITTSNPEVYNINPDAYFIIPEYENYIKFKDITDI